MVFSRLMRARHVGEIAVGDILQAAGDARRAVVLHVGHVDDLGEALRDQAHQVGAGVLFAEEVDLHVGGGIVAGDPAAQRFGGLDVHPGGDVAVVVDRIHLVLEALVDPHLRGLHAHHAEIAHDFRHDFRRGHDARRARAVDLDADHVLRADEARPSVARVAVAGEGAHAARHHFAHRRRDPPFRIPRRSTFPPCTTTTCPG